MVSKAEQSRRSPPTPLSAERVAAWLRQHPDFLTDRPDLAAILTPPPAHATEGRDAPVDFGRFLVQRLQRDLAAAQTGEAKAVDAARRQIKQQERIHDACVALIDSRSFEHFVEAITTDVAVTLQLDAVGLCIEAGEEQPNGRTRSGVNLLPAGAVNALLGGPDETERCRDMIRAERRIYGGAASLVRSDILIRLKVSAGAPDGLLALGSREEEAFHDRAGLQQYLFLARVIESTARAWLNLPD